MITLAHAGVRIAIVPARGALVTSVTVDDVELLYLDAATLADPTKNVRGGIPILFPFAGRLANDHFALANTTMTQHGFGRARAWDVLESSATHVRLGLAADDHTRAVYPYAFAAEHVVRVLPRGVQLELAIAATDDHPVPVSPGWHPYVAVAAADKALVRGDVPGFTPDRLGDDREFDFGLPAPAHGRARFDVPGLGALALEHAPEMRHLQFWSLPGKPFICLEPFFGPAGTIDTDRRAWVPAGEVRTFWMRLERR